MARLKSSADMVKAIEAAVRFYEEPPTKGMTVETHWSDVWLSADDWAEAFDAPEPGTPHNEARDQIWEELVTILIDKHDGDAPADLLRRSLRQNEELRTTFNRAWPLIEAADLVGDLWSVPAYLRRCAPWLSPDEVRRLQRADAQAWTVSDLPLLDAARQRLGDPEASRRKRRREAAVAAEREQMAQVVDDLIEADDDEYGAGLVTMLRGEDLQDALVDEAALPSADPDLLAGPFAHIVVDEAQELTDAEWQMLLLRCPSRSFTIVGDRAQARHGFTESWQERLERVGLDRISLASLSINYRTPEEVMAEAEPVIRAVLPDANVPTSIRSTGVPVVHGSAVGAGLDPRHLARRARRRDRLRHRRSRRSVGDVPRPVADPGAGEGSRVRPGRPRRPGGVRHGHRGSGRPLRRDDPGDPAARHPHELLITRFGARRRTGPGVRRCPQGRGRTDEHPVAPVVQPFGRVGEVPVGQARVQPPGEADDLLHGVAVQRGRGVHIVTRLDPAGQGAHLAADHVLEVEDRAELHDHRTAGAVEVGHLQHHLLPARRGDDPLGHAVTQTVEDVAEAAGLVAALGPEPGLAQREPPPRRPRPPRRPLRR